MLEASLVILSLTAIIGLAYTLGKANMRRQQQNRSLRVKQNQLEAANNRPHGLADLLKQLRTGRF